jgi:hypothetical protein
VLTIPALVIDVTDRDDPVRVGENTVYRITVKNVGTGPTPACAWWRSSRGPPVREGQRPDAGKSGESRVVFDALPQLAAGQSATWEVEVKAAEAGDVRFRVEMTSDSLKEPVIGTQPTRLY